MRPLIDIRCCALVVYNVADQIIQNDSATNEKAQMKYQTSEKMFETLFVL